MRGVIARLNNLFRYCRPTSVAVALLLLWQTPLGFCETNQATSPTQISRTITIATGEYPPWTGSALPHDGYVNHIITEAFANQGVKVDFVYQPWKRAFEEARQGKFDATSYWYESTERRESMLFSDLLITNRTVFFQRRNEAEIHWKTLSDLSQYRMSATLGFTYTEDFYRAIDSNIISPIMVPSDVQNLKLLMAKRTDIFATDEMCGFYMAAQLSIDPRKLKVVEPALVSPKGYLLASKTNPDSVLIIDTFNRGLRAMKANGTYQAILDRVDNTSFYDPLAKNIAPSDHP
ncbi:substrate-binding periplasmic protein [Cellvibrio sp.]|jgi:polar amino acid transport system substrate-binding protein